MSAAWGELVNRAVTRFGRLDVAAVFPPSGSTRGVARGPFLDAGVQELRDLYGYYDSTFHALHAVIPVMRRQQSGQTAHSFSFSGGWQAR